MSLTVRAKGLSKSAPPQCVLLWRVVLHVLSHSQPNVYPPAQAPCPSVTCRTSTVPELRPITATSDALVLLFFKVQTTRNLLLDGAALWEPMVVVQYDIPTSEDRACF